MVPLWYYIGTLLETNMGRARTGKTSIGEIRVKRGNGDVYVYERELAYNPETRKTFTVRKRLLGKIPAGQHEIVPTRPQKKRRRQ